jgi:hypothetical protein
MLIIFIILSHQPEGKLKKMIRILKNEGGILAAEGGIVIAEGGILKNKGGILSAEGGIVVAKGGILKNEGGILNYQVRIFKNMVRMLALAMLLLSPGYHRLRTAVPSPRGFWKGSNIRAAR